MPTLFKPQDQKPQDDSQIGMGAPQTAPAQPVSISGSPAETDKGKNVSEINKPSTSGRFQNLNAYVKANQGANVAGNVNDTLLSKGNELQTNFANAKQNYQQSVENARQRYNPELFNQVSQDPSKFVQNEENVNKFNQMRDATYQGPTELDPNATLRGQAQNFSDLAGQTGTEQGRYNLLRQIYNNPTYSSGQQKLDNLLLQSNPNQLAQLQNSRVLSNQIQNQLGTTVDQSKIQANQAAQEALATQNQTRQGLNSLVSGFDTSLGGDVQKAIDAYNNKFQTEQQGLGGQGISSDDALQFGLIKNLGDKGANIYNLDPSKYLTQNQNYDSNNPDVINQLKTSVASPEQYARIQALAKLEGNNTSGDVSKILDAYGNPSLAGTFQKESPYTFNTNKFQHDLAGVQGEYNTKSTPVQGQINQAKSALTNSGGDSPYQGGLLGEVARNASPLRTKMQDEYNKQVALAKTLPFMKVTAPNPTGISDLDLLQNYGSTPIVNNGTTLGSSNPYASLIAGVKGNQQKQINAEQALKQLSNAYGLNKTLNITDADKYAPVKINTNTGRQI